MEQCLPGADYQASIIVLTAIGVVVTVVAIWLFYGKAVWWPAIVVWRERVKSRVFNLKEGTEE